MILCRGRCPSHSCWYWRPVEQIERDIVFRVRSRGKPRCPSCSGSEVSYHSTYVRRLRDLPWQGQPVQVQVKTRATRFLQWASRPLLNTSNENKILVSRRIMTKLVSRPGRLVLSAAYRPFETYPFEPDGTLQELGCSKRPLPWPSFGNPFGTAVVSVP